MSDKYIESNREKFNITNTILKNLQFDSLPKVICNFWCTKFNCNVYLNSLSVDPSKGRLPETSVYRMTPRDQTSTSGPSYFLPEQK